MSDAHFWRNFGMIAAAHIALLLAFVRWSESMRTHIAQIVWLSGDAFPSAPTTIPDAASPPPAVELVEDDSAQPEAVASPAALQFATPAASVAATPRATAMPTTAATRKVTPRPAPTRKPQSKPHPKPAANPVAPKQRPKPEGAGKITANDSGTGSAQSGRAAAAPLEGQWYGRMLHDRFNNAWDQPKSVVASGVRISAGVKIRIERDGRVSGFDLVRPSGNVLMDESVRAIGTRVTHVDPLPAGIGNSDSYEATISFTLNGDR